MKTKDELVRELTDVVIADAQFNFNGRDVMNLGKLRRSICDATEGCDECILSQARTEGKTVCSTISGLVNQVREAVHSEVSNWIR